MGHHMPPMVTALKFLLSSYIAPGWSLLQEEVWAWSTAKRRMHQGNHRLAGTLGTWFLIFIFRKFTAGKGYRLCGLKIDGLPEHVSLLCLHTLVLDSLQPPLANLASFCVFTSQNQSPTVPNQTLWTEWIPTDMINFPTSCIHSVTTQPHSSAGKTTQDLGSLALRFRSSNLRKISRRQSHTLASIATDLLFLPHLPWASLIHISYRLWTSYNHHNPYSLRTLTHVLLNGARKIYFEKSIHSSWATKPPPQHWVSNQKLPV